MIRVLAAEMRRALLDAARYPLETACAAAVLFIILSMLLGGVATDHGDHAAQLARLTVLYAEWVFMMPLVSDAASEIEQDLYNGTFAHIAQSAFALQAILVVRACASLTVSSIWALVVMAIAAVAYAVDPRQGAFSAWELAFAAMQALSVGLLLAAVAISIKRSRSVISLAPFFLMPVWMFRTPAGGMQAWLDWLPLCNAVASEGLAFKGTVTAAWFAFAWWSVSHSVRRERRRHSLLSL